MFIVKKECGQLFSVAHVKDRNFLLKMRKRESFYCPCCSQKVILKLGTKRTYHFSHVPGSPCTVETEPESEYHMSGKLQLFEWLEEQALAPSLEPYIPEIQQRPDIMFMYEKKPHVIEFQCSPLSEQLFSKRTRQYLENRFTPIWILGASKLTRKSSYLFSLSQFQRFFLRETTNKQWLLPTYCPTEKRFILLEQIISLSTQNVLAKPRLLSRERLSFEQLLYFQTSEDDSVNSLLIDWGNRKEKALQMYPLHPGAHRDLLLKELYEKRLNLTKLPSVVGLPTPSSLYVRTAPFIWQAYVYIDNFHGKKCGELVYAEDVWFHFMNRVKRGHISINKPLFFKKGTPYDTIRTYLHLLSEMKLLKKLDEGTFKIMSNAINETRNSADFLKKHHLKIREQFGGDKI